MNALKSQINSVTARIRQISESELFSIEEREHLIKINQKELDDLKLLQAKEMTVTNPEIL